MFPTFSLFLEPTPNSAFRFSRFYIPAIRGMQHTSLAGQATLKKRGLYTLRDVKALSRYPFGFFTKGRKYAAQAECLCYPEILPLDQMNLASLDLRGSRERFERGIGHDLYMIRDYIPSDSARHVHWKASAKASTLKTREYAAEESRRVTLIFDRFGHPGDIDPFERLVSYSASLVYHLIQDGIEVRFIADDWQSSSLEAILEYLALVQMSNSPETPPAGESAFRLSLRA
jgi:uncharacterized protein (DUF58 family)